VLGIEVLMLSSTGGRVLCLLVVEVDCRCCWAGGEGDSVEEEEESVQGNGAERGGAGDERVELEARLRCFVLGEDIRPAEDEPGVEDMDEARPRLDPNARTPPPPRLESDIDPSPLPLPLLLPPPPPPLLDLCRLELGAESCEVELPMSRTLLLRRTPGQSSVETVSREVPLLPLRPGPLPLPLALALVLSSPPSALAPCPPSHR